jgi:hypothetical protein
MELGVGYHPWIVRRTNGEGVSQNSHLLPLLMWHPFLFSIIGIPPPGIPPPSASAFMLVVLSPLLVCSVNFSILILVSSWGGRVERKKEEEGTARRRTSERSRVTELYGFIAVLSEVVGVGGEEGRGGNRGEGGQFFNVK